MISDSVIDARGLLSVMWQATKDAGKQCWDDAMQTETTLATEYLTSHVNLSETKIVKATGGASCSSG